MPQQIIYLDECPFCENGEIHFDAREASLDNLRRISDRDFKVGPDQRIIVYNSDRPDFGPCEHFVDVYGDITPYQSKDVAQVPFHWHSPLRKQLDPDRVAFNHLLDLIESDGTVPNVESDIRMADDEYFDLDADELEYDLAPEDRFAYQGRLRAYCPQTSFKHDRFARDFIIESVPMYVQGMFIFADDVRKFIRELQIGFEQRNRDWDAVHSS